MAEATSSIVEGESKPYEPPEKVPPEAWLTRAKAAKALGVSKSTLGNKVRAGKIVSRVDQGIRLFAVGAGAAKAMLSAKAKATEDYDEQAIVEAFASGVDALQMIAELRISPRVVARTLKDLREALAVSREMAEAERIREIEIGHPDLPTTWAWCDFLFKHPDTTTYADAKKKFDAWVESGGTVERASPFVRQALENADTWLAARRLWSGEVQRAADKKAREAIAEEHRVRMIVAKEEAAERSKQVAQQRRTAALVAAAAGKSRKSRVKQSTESMDERNDGEYKDPSTLEEGST